MGKNILLKLLYFSLFFSLTFFGFISTAQSQVSITVGAQELYDDNIFLENDRRRPAPFVLNDNLLNDLRDGDLSTVLSESNDGNPDDDIISNLFIEFSNKPSEGKYFDSTYKLKTGFLLFANFSEQDRLTLDGNLLLNLSDRVLPKPYYVTLDNALQSASNNLSVAGGTATQTTENYVITGEAGISEVSLFDQVTFNLGYTGSYQKYLGELLLNNNSNSDSQTSLSGVDFYSNTVDTSVNNQVTRDLELGVRGSAGVQIFTDIENSGGTTATTDPEDLDRNNAEVQGTSKYVISKKLSFDGSAGVGFSQLRNSQPSRIVEFIDENGVTQSRTFTPDDSNSGLTYTFSLNYVYRPGSLLTIGSNEGFSTDVDGQRLTSTSYFANIIEPLTDSLQLTLGSRYLEFDNQSINAAGTTSRYEGSISLNYNITQSTAFNIGYNYSKQDGQSSLLEDRLGTSEPDYAVNRFFIGINTGFVGLPL